MCLAHVPHAAFPCSAAVGAWSGQLWGLVQDLTPGDNAVDGLALTYADEQKITDAGGNVTTLILQMQVGSSCRRPRVSLVFFFC